MILYNITILVDKSIEQEWLEWITIKHIPNVLKTGCFLSAKINRIINNNEPNQSFAISYECESMKKMHLYKTKYSKKLSNDYLERFGNKTDSFRTLLEVIKSF